ncbi:MAG: hypothetical protein WD772_05605 [Pseudohongiellaceae bacterium]
MSGTPQFPVNSGYQQQLATAYGVMLQGRADEAITLLGKAMTKYLQKQKPEAEWNAGQLFLIRNWPALGLTLHTGSNAAVITLDKEKYSLLEAGAYLRHFIHSVSLNTPGRDHLLLYRSVQFILPVLVKMQHQFAVNAQFQERRRLLQLSTGIQLSLEATAPGYCDYLRLLVYQIAFYLREPMDCARRIVQENRLFTALVTLRRERQRSVQERRNCLARFHWQQRAEYLLLQATDRRSRVIAAFHFGDFVNGLECFSSATLRQRRRRLVRYEDHSFNSRRHRYEDALTRRRELPEMANSQHLEPLEAVAFLRGGNANLTIFCDLPPGHGESVQVQFLGRQAWFTRGVAEIAMLARVPILPVITYEHQGKNHVRLPGLIETRMRNGESMSQSVIRITQLLVNVLESHVVRNPAQWYYLPRLSSYFVSDGGMDPLQA